MLTRSELRQLMTAARKGWSTAAKRRQQAVRDYKRFSPIQKHPITCDRRRVSA